MKFTDQAIQQLFTAGNYKFSTKDPDRDQPTLYFEDASGNKGRIRQAHSQGQVIVFSGKCKRTFQDTPEEIDDTNKDKIKTSTSPIEGYHVVEEDDKHFHGSKGIVQSAQLNQQAIHQFNLALFKDYPINDWTSN
jgi:hypothetical protein